ncbi:MAG: peptidoglycan editing factor PgeF [Candidatus Omnitrophica bacterium]|nr:peptidoglycan editing factor PgeF [Candidatus Omnitrophota bacterium]
MHSGITVLSAGFFLSQWRAQGVGAACSFRAHDYALRAGQSAAEQLAVVNARERWMRQFAFSPEHAVFMNQTHGSAAMVVAAADTGRGLRDPAQAVPQCDALLCATPGIALCALTADCAPVFLFDAARRVIALVHAGWRGTRQNIVGRTVESMCHTFASAPENIRVFLGPALRDCCFEVGEEFIGYFPHAVRRRGERLFFDIAAEIAGQAARSGIPRAQIFDVKLCTHCLRDRFFSYRGGDRCARNLSVMSLCHV